jgi:hypothetical protein
MEMTGYAVVGGDDDRREKERERHHHRHAPQLLLSHFFFFPKQNGERARQKKIAGVYNPIIAIDSHIFRY